MEDPMTGSRTDISVTNRPADHEYYLILRARVSVSQHATRESGADVDIYDVRATALVPPVEVPADDTQIVVRLGVVAKSEAEDVCDRVAASGLLQAAFQARTDPGRTNARIVDQDAVSAIRTLATSGTSAPAEVRRSVGRPSIGPKVQVRFADEQIAQLDQRAEALGVDRSEMVRRYVAAGLRQPAIALDAEHLIELVDLARQDPTRATIIVDRDGVRAALVDDDETTDWGTPYDVDQRPWVVGRVDMLAHLIWPHCGCPAWWPQPGEYDDAVHGARLVAEINDELGLDWGAFNVMAAAWNASHEQR
jgi:hypothetical protein